MNINVSGLAKKTAAEALKIALEEGSLKGIALKVANKVMTSYSDALNNITDDNMKAGLEGLVRQAVLQIANAICRKAAVAVSIVIGIIAIIAIIITLIAGGNILVPLMVSVVFIVLLWLVAKIISRFAAEKISKTTANLVFAAVENVVVRFNQKQMERGDSL